MDVEMDPEMNVYKKTLFSFLEPLLAFVCLRSFKKVLKSANRTLNFFLKKINMGI